MIGGILSDEAIADAIVRKEIEIDPFDTSRLNPASYDLALGEEVCVYAHWVMDDVNSDRVLPGITPSERDGRHLHSASPYHSAFDVREEPHTRSYSIGEEGWVLRPNILYLMHTRETIGSRKYVMVIDGKSSLGRLGVSIHETAGYGDPGFRGQFTLEVSVQHPIRVYAGMRFCQMRFHTVVGQPTPYAGNYTGEASRGPVPSRAWKQFK